MTGVSDLVLALDYDGTLVPFADAPDLAVPDAELLDLLAHLAARPRTAVHIVSGRSRESLERWLGALPIGLFAEHGYWSRALRSDEWSAAADVDLRFMPQVRAVFEEVVRAVPGSFVETKHAGLAWHYRRAADAVAAREQAASLRDALASLAATAHFDVLDGAKVVEARARGVHKGMVAQRLVNAAAPDGELVAIGDDKTDEDLFAALPADAETYRVGPGPSIAKHRLADVRAVRDFLARFL
jgi:trehalose 6-phosphate synthase/phosphatase